MLHVLVYLLFCIEHLLLLPLWVIAKARWPTHTGFCPLLSGVRSAPSVLETNVLYSILILCYLSIPLRARLEIAFLEGLVA